MLNPYTYFLWRTISIFFDRLVYTFKCYVKFITSRLNTEWSIVSYFCLRSWNINDSSGWSIIHEKIATQDHHYLLEWEWERPRLLVCFLSFHINIYIIIFSLCYYSNLSSKFFYSILVFFIFSEKGNLANDPYDVNLLSLLLDIHSFQRSLHLFISTLESIHLSKYYLNIPPKMVKILFSIKISINK